MDDRGMAFVVGVARGEGVWRDWVIGSWYGACSLGEAAINLSV